MNSYFLHIAYVGSNFFGWQIQTCLRTIQGVLWKAIQTIDINVPMPVGTSRTDSGVHANYQGVLIRLKKEWNCYRLLSAINAHLPNDIKVMDVKAVPKEFFPRAHVIGKRYCYRIQEGPSKNPFLNDRTWHIFGSSPLNRADIQKAALFLVGTHDFASFRHKDCSALSTNKTIYSISFDNTDNELNIIFDGNSFLMHMIRIIVGTLIDIGKGRLNPNDMSNILQAKNRQQAGFTAPSCGLYLERIWYQTHWGINDLPPWQL